MVDVTPSVLNNNVHATPQKFSEGIGVGGTSASAANAEKARIWAEGNDTQVEKLGGEHSAKGWAQSIGDGFMPKSGGTFTGDVTMASGKKINFQQSNISENNAGNIIIGGGNGNGLVVTKNGSGAALFYNNGSDYTELVTRNDVKSTYSSTGTDPLNGTAVAQALVNFTGADGDNAGTSGMVPAPAAADNTKFLRGDGTWADAGSGEGVYTTTNLIAGTNTTITQVEQPIIDSNTLGVFHFEGNNNNAVTGVSLAITTEVSGGGTLGISSAQHKFGEESTNFVCSTSSAYGTLFASGALSFLTGQDFTIDFWAKWEKASYGAIYPFYVGSSYLYGFGTYNGYFRVFNYGSQYTPTNVPAGFSLSNWNHFAIERVGNAINWYTDGVKIYTANQSSEAKVQMRILDGSTSNVIYVDELRISNVARYNGNSYTVNTQPYSYGEEKYQINTDLTSVSGYNASATQVLKNVNGVLTWVTE